MKLSRGQRVTPCGIVEANSGDWRLEGSSSCFAGVMAWGCWLVAAPAAAASSLLEHELQLKNMMRLGTRATISWLEREQLGGRRPGPL
jgi:hypothetical protein